jgi:hypothetical protein
MGAFRHIQVSMVRPAAEMEGQCYLDAGQHVAQVQGSFTGAHIVSLGLPCAAALQMVVWELRLKLSREDIGVPPSQQRVDDVLETE